MSAQLKIRPAQPADVPTIFELIGALAEYENLSGEVIGDVESLSEHLFGKRPYAEALLAEWEGESVGFALFFDRYSTFLTQPGLYLEDLFVLRNYRGRGIGKALIGQVARIAIERGCARLEWAVLDWNEPAIAFYQDIGATVLPHWRICRLVGDSLSDFARGTHRD
ncbi:GNAT family N-acetyltransferase [Oscillatoriales cyanobacterium LEGE 11467]|uniref:GNAT family N-acetyltransferase n=1 Tax=Zarconia navalis LEGE 11467 TaxID=1828826 RepID=A0A928W1C7_9CYAN|nr:GNAT family N-acetyltransferase [Zarconia navalis]MBE9041480.1 GNAT family N-acetyltransferase [Zarconia navalis LEGE 11467]